MTAINKKVGRPISNVQNAQGKYAMLKDAMAVAKREFEDFEKLCLAQELLAKVENPAKAVEVKAHTRRHFDRVWKA